MAQAVIPPPLRRGTPAKTEYSNASRLPAPQPLWQLRHCSGPLSFNRCLGSCHSSRIGRKSNATGCSGASYNDQSAAVEECPVAALIRFPARAVSVPDCNKSAGAAEGELGSFGTDEI